MSNQTYVQYCKLSYHYNTIKATYAWLAFTLKFKGAEHISFLTSKMMSIDLM